MSNPTDTSRSAVSTTETEMRLRAAMENAQLKKNAGEKPLIKRSPSENALSTTEMRLKEAMEIARSKAGLSEHQEPKKPVNTFPNSVPAKSKSKNHSRENIARRNVSAAGKAKASEQSWLARQAAKLLGSLSLGKRSAAR